MIDLTKTYRRPNRSDDIKEIQRALHLVQDGIYGTLTEEAVRQFQRENGLTADGICGPKTLAALFPLADADGVPQLAASRRRIDEIIVHCTATPEGRAVTVADITKWHRQRGFATIGYHYVISLDGKIQMGRDVNTAGAHATGHNSHSLGVVYVGGLDTAGQPKDTRTETQRKSLTALVARLCKMYPGVKVLGHRELSPDLNGNGQVDPWEWSKACPCFEVSTLRTELRQLGCKC